MQVQSTTLCLTTLFLISIGLDKLVEGEILSWDKRDFTVKSKVSLTTTIERTHIHINEAYSAKQKRAIFTFDSVTNTSNSISTKKGKIYFDSNRDKIISIEDDDLERCTVVCRDYVRSVIFGHPLKVLDELFLQQDKHIVGPAGLLLAIDHLKDKMKLIKIDTYLSFESRNSQVVVYELSHKLKSGEKLNFSVHYLKALLGPGVSSLPSTINLIADGFALSIEYTQPSVVEEISGPLVSSANLVVMDPFALPPVSGCEDEMKLWETLFDDARRRFSFEVEHHRYEKILPSNPRYFVAYDQALDSMRFDRIPHSTTISHERHQIFNFRMNRMYSVAKLLDETDHKTFGTILRLARRGSKFEAGDILCVVSEIFPTSQNNTTKEPLMSIGKLIAGAEKFVYLGKAHVRGVAARVYEASDPSYPYWLNPSMVYVGMDDGEMHTRDPKDGANLDNFLGKLSVLVYLADTNEPHLPNGPLLLVRVVNEKRGLTSYEDLEIFNFVWDIDHYSPRGDRAEDMFSLAHSCSDDIGSYKYARIDLLLEQPTKQPKMYTNADIIILWSSHGRNLGLLGALAETLDLPSTMIFDLESKLIHEPSRDPKPVHSIAVSFRLADHTDNLFRMTYIGTGKPNSEYKPRHIRAIRRNFHSCAVVSAHLRESIHFGFNPETRLCVTETGSYSEERTTDLNPAQFTFEIDENEPMEIYRIDHLEVSESHSPWSEGFLKQESSYIIGQEVKILEPYTSSQISFSIKALNIDETDSRSSLDEQGLTVDTTIRDDVMPGFGFPENSNISRHIAPELALSDLWSSDDKKKTYRPTMNFELCQTVCLMDETCQSFSLCSRRFELDCQISHISFRRPYLVAQIAKALKNVPPHLVDIQMSDPPPAPSSIQIHKHPKCDLYSKMYLEFFSRSRREYKYPEELYFRKMESREDCAQVCTKVNLNLLKTSASKLGRDIKTNTGDKKLTDALNDRARKANQNFCKAFHYLSKRQFRQLDDKSQKLIESQLEAKERINGYYKGYCMLETGNRTPSFETGESKKKSQMVPVRRYPFRLDMFYEKRPGLRLNGSPPGATSLVSGEQTHTDNYQLVVQASRSRCAQICFLQVIGPELGCRSFGIEVESDRKGGRVWCYLNSMTLKEVISRQRYDLVQDIAEDEAQLFHYEPRSGEMFYDLFMIPRSSPAPDEKPNGHSESHFRLGTFTLLFISVLGLLTGFFISLKYTELVLERLSSSLGIRPVASEKLVGNMTAIFQNQVDYEGRVVDH